MATTLDKNGPVSMTLAAEFNNFVQVASTATDGSTMDLTNVPEYTALCNRAAEAFGEIDGDKGLSAQQRLAAKQEVYGSILEAVKKINVATADQIDRQHAAYMDELRALLPVQSDAFVVECCRMWDQVDPIEQKLVWQQLDARTRAALVQSTPRIVPGKRGRMSTVAHRVPDDLRTEHLVSLLPGAEEKLFALQESRRRSEFYGNSLLGMLRRREVPFVWSPARDGQGNTVSPIRRDAPAAASGSLEV